MLNPADVLDFWFGPERGQVLSDKQYLQTRGRLWFRGGRARDELLPFEPAILRAGARALEGAAWESDAGLLAQVVLLDQLARELWRGTPRAFCYDAVALELAGRLLRQGLGRWETAEAMFLLTPLLHSEDPADHEKLEALLAADAEERRARGVPPRLDGTAASARSHWAVVQRFGRYPHRNELCGRISTPEEVRWLREEAPGWAKSQEPPGETAAAAQPPRAPPGQRSEDAHEAVRLVSLDCTGTLFEWSAPIGELYSRAAARALGPDHAVPGGAAVMAAFGPAFVEGTARWPNFGYGRLSSRDFWSKVAQATFQACGCSWASDGKLFDQAFDEIYRLFQTAEAYTVFEDVIPFFRWVARQGYVVACVSNTTESYRDHILPTMGLAPMIHFGIFSKVEGVEKPGAAFDLLLEQGRLLLPGLQPQQVLHIGDHRRKDAEGAVAHGFHAALLDRSQGSQPTEDLGRQGIVVARSLREVQHRLESTGGLWTAG